MEFAEELVNLGFKIIASGGTAKELSAGGIEVTDVATMVGGGPILGHRVVTLSREIHAGLLARDTKEDRSELERLKIPWIDLVYVDLYPLQSAIEEVTSASKELPPTPSLEKRGSEAILEKTDIGGPTMLRSAAKGRRIVIADTADRFKVIEWLKFGEPDKENFISSLAAKAEMVVANYALASARYHSGGNIEGFIAEQVLETKYGENAWQAPAGLYSNPSLALPSGGEGTGQDPLSMANFKLVAGTSPSYNNFADVDRLLQTVTHIAAVFDVNYGKVPFIAVGVKHGNPCGACAIEENPKEAIQKMLEGDLRAIFGGVVMVNFEINDELAEILLTHKMGGGRRLLDGIIAPAFTTSAIEMLKRKGDKCRFLVNPALAKLSKDSLDKHTRFRYVRGGFLKQPNYRFVLDLRTLTPRLRQGYGGQANLSSKGRGEPEVIGELNFTQARDLLLAWAVGTTSNSNTVTLVKRRMLIGNGVGQQDRVSCCELAIKRATSAGHDTKDASAYSDSFFPFVDGVEVLSRAGIKTIFATTGSVRDDEIKKFCADNGIAFVSLPDSEARGFFGH